MALLPPTLVGPIADCNEVVRVHNVLPGSDVFIVVEREGRLDPISAPTRAIFSFIDVALTESLTPGMSLRAQQRRGGPGGATETSAPSTAVGVQRAADELAPPVALRELTECSECLRLTGLAPGARAVARRGGVTIGTSNPAMDGEVDLHFTEAVRRTESVDIHQEQCGNESASASHEVLQPEELLVPRILGDGTPDDPVLKACTRGFHATDLANGAIYTVTRSGDSSFRGCVDLGPSRLIVLAAPLRDGETVTIGQEYPRCDIDAEASEARVEARAPRRPVIVPPLCAGGRRLHLAGIEIGARIEVKVDGEPVGENFTSDHYPWLPEPLRAGQTVVVRQYLCDRWSDSEAVPVSPSPAPESVPEPRIVEPLVACAVEVSGTHLWPGGVVAVHSDRFGRISDGVRVNTSEATISVRPPLTEGDRIQLHVWPCGGAEVVVGEWATVARAAELPALEVIARAGDNFVTINNALIGSRIDVLLDVPGRRTWLGGGFVSREMGQEITLRRELVLEADVLLVRQRLCGETNESEAPVLRPCPEAPLLRELGEDETWVELNPTFQWRDPGAGSDRQAESFILQVFKMGEAEPAIEQTTSGQSLSVAGLDPLVRYRWRVVATSEDCPEGTPSDFGTFRTRPVEVEFRLRAAPPAERAELEVQLDSKWVIDDHRGGRKEVEISDFARISDPEVVRYPAPSNRTVFWRIRLRLVLSGYYINDRGFAEHIGNNAIAESDWRMFSFPEDGVVSVTSRVVLEGVRVALTDPRIS